MNTQVPATSSQNPISGKEEKWTFHSDHFQQCNDPEEEERIARTDFDCNHITKDVQLPQVSYQEKRKMDLTFRAFSAL